MAFLTAFRRRFPLTQELNGNSYTVEKPKETKETVRKSWPKITETEARRLVLDHLAAHGELPQSFLAWRGGVSKSCVSKWLAKWERDGIVRRVRRGREKVIRLPAKRRAKAIADV